MMIDIGRDNLVSRPALAAVQTRVENRVMKNIADVHILVQIVIQFSL